MVTYLCIIPQLLPFSMPTVFLSVTVNKKVKITSTESMRETPGDKRLIHELQSKGIKMLQLHIKHVTGQQSPFCQLSISPHIWLFTSLWAAIYSAAVKKNQAKGHSEMAPSESLKKLFRGQTRFPHLTNKPSWISASHLLLLIYLFVTKTMVSSCFSFP